VPKESFPRRRRSPGRGPPRALPRPSRAIERAPSWPQDALNDLAIPKVLSGIDLEGTQEGREDIRRRHRTHTVGEHPCVGGQKLLGVARSVDHVAAELR